jgi:TonB family protein
VADAEVPGVEAGGALVSRSGDVAGVRAGGVLSDRGGAPGGDVLDGGDVAATGSESGRRTILDYGEGGGGGGGALEGRARRDPAGDVADVLPEDKPEADDLQSAEVDLGGKGVSMSISGEISDRNIVTAVPPDYPDQAKSKGWEGAVAVHFTVLPNGTVKDNMYLEQAAAHHVLNEAAMAALKKWKFSPLEKGKAQVEQWGI